MLLLVSLTPGQEHEQNWAAAESRVKTEVRNLLGHLDSSQHCAIQSGSKRGLAFETGFHCGVDLQPLPDKEPE